jgi:ribonucleoside-diphosphate reductase alpha chain
MSYKWLTDESRLFLSRGYLSEGVTVEQRVKEISDRAEVLTGIKGFSKKFEEYVSKGYFSLSSPVWSNYGTTRGLPVSCFGSYVQDDMADILSTHSEVGMLSKFGGGTSGYFGALRHRGTTIKGLGQSDGAVSFVRLFDTLSNVVSQGSVRRGFFSAYLPIEHGDFDEFVGIGSDGHPIQNITHGITVTDKFLRDMVEGNAENRRRWAKVIETRGEVGYPYIFFTDTVNTNKPDCFKEQFSFDGKDKTIFASNMCSEIALPSNESETFVCVLSSMNLLMYDEWKDTDAVETLTVFLDSVVSEFIVRAEELSQVNPKAYAAIKKAVDFSRNWRALGLGGLGWHSYLQSKMIPFESREAAKLNLEIFKLLKHRSYKASSDMAEMWGAPSNLSTSKRRNATLLAVAPTKSSSFILGGMSQGIEPELSNFYIKDLAKIKTTVKNPYLQKLLIEKGMDTEEVWDSIKKEDGSVQHLTFLSDFEKDVFKTFIEINPETVIDQAAVRQAYIDQSQSLNLMVDPNMPTRDINKLYLKAWSLGVKTLYYQYNLNSAQALRRSKYANKDDCVACSG